MNLVLCSFTNGSKHPTASPFIRKSQVLFGFSFINSSVGSAINAISRFYCIEIISLPIQTGEWAGLLSERKTNSNPVCKEENSRSSLPNCPLAPVTSILDFIFILIKLKLFLHLQIKIALYLFLDTISFPAGIFQSIFKEGSS